MADLKEVAKQSLAQAALIVAWRQPVPRYPSSTIPLSILGSLIKTEQQEKGYLQHQGVTEEPRHMYGQGSWGLISTWPVAAWAREKRGSGGKPHQPESRGARPNR